MCRWYSLVKLEIQLCIPIYTSFYTQIVKRLVVTNFIFLLGHTRLYCVACDRCVIRSGKFTRVSCSRNVRTEPDLETSLVSGFSDFHQVLRENARLIRPFLQSTNLSGSLNLSKVRDPSIAAGTTWFSSEKQSNYFIRTLWTCLF